MTDVGPAVHAAPEGVLLDVELVPGATRDAFPAGYNSWRKRIEARVAAPAVEGRANAALVEVVAAFLDVATRDVRVIAGATSRQKRLLVLGRGREDILAALAKAPTLL